MGFAALRLVQYGAVGPRVDAVESRMFVDLVKLGFGKRLAATQASAARLPLPTPPQGGAAPPRRGAPHRKRIAPAVWGQPNVATRASKRADDGSARRLAEQRVATADALAHKAVYSDEEGRAAAPSPASGSGAPGPSSS